MHLPLVAFLPISMILIFKWPWLWQYLLALFLGIVTAIIDLGTDEVQLSVLLLLVFGFFLGFNQPKSAWHMAMLLGIWIPIFRLIDIFLSQGSHKLVPEGFGPFLAVVPALIGAYGGVFLQTTVERKGKPSSRTIV